MVLKLEEFDTKIPALMSDIEVRQHLISLPTSLHFDCIKKSRKN